ncbi:multi-sensor hybrid histidine kinase, partial [Planoprotostelium fungivorum]
MNNSNDTDSTDSMPFSPLTLDNLSDADLFPEEYFTSEFDIIQREVVVMGDERSHQAEEIENKQIHMIVFTLLNAGRARLDEAGQRDLVWHNVRRGDPTLWSVESFLQAQGIPNTVQPGKGNKGYKFVEAVRELDELFSARLAELESVEEFFLKETMLILESQSRVRPVGIEEASARLQKIADQFENVKYALKFSACSAVMEHYKYCLPSGPNRSPVSLPPKGKLMLEQWFLQHSDNPYPSEEQKVQLASRNNMTMKQLNYWFGNKRVRSKKRGIKEEEWHRIFLAFEPASPQRGAYHRTIIKSESEGSKCSRVQSLSTSQPPVTWTTGLFDPVKKNSRPFIRRMLRLYVPVLRGRPFVLSAVLALVLPCLFLLSLLGGAPLFRFVITIMCAVICINIFCIFWLSQTVSHSDGFFMIVGLGYGFVAEFSVLNSRTGILTILGRASIVKQLPTYLDVDGANSGYQLDNFARYNEIGSIILGIALARFRFRGWKHSFVALLFILLVNTILLSSIWWWRVYPSCFSSGAATPFYINHQYAFIALFGLCILLILVQRPVFADNVFVFVTVALILRLISTIFASTITLSPVPLILSNLFRFSSFLFLCISIGLSLLSNPLNTLCRNLDSKGDALEDEKVPAIGLSIKTDGIIQHINQYGRKSLGLSNDISAGSNFFETFLFDEADKDEIASKLLGQLSSSHMNEQMIMTSQRTRFSDGVEKQHVIEWSFKNMRTSSTLGDMENRIFRSIDILKGDIDIELHSEFRGTILCLGRDLTDQVERERLLRDAKIEADKLAIMKDSFVANVSHELRTPLNCIVGVTDILSQTPHSVSPQISDMYTMIRNAGQSLLTLINDLLDFAKLRQGEMKLHRGKIALVPFVETCLMSMSLLYTNQLDIGYRIHSSCPKFIYQDENRLRQILFNLFSNSIKFTLKGQVVLIVNTCTMPNGKEGMEWSVIDSGIGMEEWAVERLFGRFFQASQGHNDKKGTGIGLAITRDIVELMGGNIYCTSEKGVGSKMTFTIPTGNRSIANSGSATGENTPNGTSRTRGG